MIHQRCTSHQTIRCGHHGDSQWRQSRLEFAYNGELAERSGRHCLQDVRIVPVCRRGYQLDQRLHAIMQLWWVTASRTIVDSAAVAKAHGH